MSQPKTTTSEMQEIYEGPIIGSEPISDGIQRSVQSNLPYHTRLNPPSRPKLKIKKPTKVQVNPYVASSPQELLERHGMYKDPSLYTRNPQRIYLDLTKYDNYQEMLNKSIEAKNHFASLDVDVRAKFNHDPSKFAEYLASDSFDINYILTDQEKIAYDKYQNKIKEEQDWNEYINSDEYKQIKAEKQAYQDYQKQQFNDWKKNR